MDGSVSSIITLGFGNGTFAPEIGLVVTLGFGVGEVSAVTLVGQWSNVIDCRSANERINIKDSNNRLNIHGANQRVEI